MCARRLVLVLFLVVPVVYGAADLEDQLSQESCQLISNNTLKQLFQRSVRRTYPNATSNLNSNRIARVPVNALGSIKCYSTCPRVSRMNVTWCVHIYHPAEEVNICFNNSGLISLTPLAATLNLHTQFSICDSAGTLCSSFTPFYQNHAYLVCTVQTNTCSDRTFIDVTVESSNPNVRITDFPASPTNITLGTRAILVCSATVSSSQGSIKWSNAVQDYYPISEDPFCIESKNVTCPRDTSPLAIIPRLKRVRTYITRTVLQYSMCGGNVLNMVSYLVISNVTEGDGGLYYCNASAQIVTPAMKSVNVFLVVVNPPIPTMAAQTQNASMPTTITDGTFSIMLPVQTNSSSQVLWSAVPLSIILVLVIIALVLMALLRKKIWITKRIDATNIDIAVAVQLPDPWEFPRENLSILHNRLLGKGEFGQVYKGQAIGIIPDAPERNVVAVKMVKDNAPLQEIRDLYDEMELMKKMEPHENMLNLLGYCTKPGGPLYLIIEFAMHGNLRSFLNMCEEAVLKLNRQPMITRKRSRIGSSSSTSSAHHLLSSRVPTSAHTPDSQGHFTFPPIGSSAGALPEEYRVAHAGTPMTSFAHTVAPITTDYVNCKGLIQMEDVQNFALQIASGLKHMEAMNIVHCDLAARNILIAEGFVLKISDFGMARDVSGKEYYRKSPKGRVPIKWTAPEALEEHLYTFKSDVWSFGIVLWEIFTYGHSPYPDIEIQAWEHFIQFLKDGNRPPLPSGCPENMYEIMQKCWKLNPDERPSASGLIDTFIPRCDEEALDTPTSQDSCMHVEQLQEYPERYIEN
ncbi:hypothetical protein EMCRGX_G029049 [Ephydatia muelleri]